MGVRGPYKPKKKLFVCHSEKLALLCSTKSLYSSCNSVVSGGNASRSSHRHLFFQMPVESSNIEAIIFIILYFVADVWHLIMTTITICIHPYVDTVGSYWHNRWICRAQCAASRREMFSPSDGISARRQVLARRQGGRYLQGSSHPRLNRLVEYSAEEERWQLQKSKKV